MLHLVAGCGHSGGAAATTEIWVPLFVLLWLSRTQIIARMSARRRRSLVTVTAVDSFEHEQAESRSSVQASWPGR